MYAMYKDEQYYDDPIVFDYEPPNPYLYKFNGAVKTKSGGKISIDANNFILRGCSLRNTKWVVGLCSYTGHDTKLMMNSFKGRAKRSHLENSMNNNIVLVFMLMCILSTFGAIYYIVSSIRYSDVTPYLQEDPLNSAA